MTAGDPIGTAVSFNVIVLPVWTVEPGAGETPNTEGIRSDDTA